MRIATRTILASLAVTIVSATPSLSLDRPAKPPADAPAVTRVADLDRRAFPRAGYPQADTYWNWGERARYTRWLHNEYVNAGHPVRHAYSRTYIVVVDDCCWRRRW